uniref:Astacin domain-containing protein n=1 Tax=Parastrongyloides trichosuri TaxID=131310 RepID=A0A0N4ZLC0_PARTI
MCKKLLILFYLFLFGEGSKSVLTIKIGSKDQNENNLLSKKPLSFSNLTTIEYSLSNCTNDTIKKIEKTLKYFDTITCINFTKSSNDNLVSSDKGFNFAESEECYAPNGPTKRQSDHYEYILLNAQCQSTKAPEKKHLFTKYKYNEVDLFNTSFDFLSISMFDPTEYSIDNKTVYTLNNQYFQNVTNKRNLFSLDDLKILNHIYCSDKLKFDCENNGYNLLNNSDKCMCPIYYESTKNCSKINESETGCSNISNTKLTEKNKEIIITFNGKHQCYAEILSNVTNNVTIYISKATIQEPTCTKTYGVEVQYLPDLMAPGIRLCGNHSNIMFDTNSKKIVVSYRGKDENSSLIIAFYANFNSTKTQN